jgi:hypothetical protein
VTEAEPSVASSTVVYIAGSGRSGSTLLERILGALPGYVNVGELIDTFRRVVKFDELCGCGEAFSSCDFWVRVGKRAFGGWDLAFVEEVSHLQRDVARQRHLPLLVGPQRGSEGFQEKLKRYGEVYGALYAAILTESGARVVVDASKGTAQALAVSHGTGVDLRLVHLVRDARGVAFSWAKAGVNRPQGVTAGTTMARHQPQLTAARWIRVQAEISATRRFLTASAMVRYEDLVSDPSAEIIAMMAALELPIDDESLRHVDGREVDLPLSHGLSGNPSRFKSGRQELRLDEQWRRDMARWDRLSTTTIAAGSLTRYRYLPARDRSST